MVRLLPGLGDLSRGHPRLGPMSLLMRHQTADRARRQQIMGHPAEDPFVKPTMSICPSHKQVSPFLLGEPDDLIGP